MAKKINLYNARKKNKWSLKEAAEKCGINPVYLSELENGRKDNPTIKTLNSIILVYNDKKILNDFMDIKI